MITLLCGVGLYASIFMLLKTRRALRGELYEPSVVQTPRAALYGGLPNALLGALYYIALGSAVWWVRGAPAAAAVLGAAVFAAATSAALAYSLLFITRRSCPYCWAGHVVNWALLTLCAWLFLPDILSRAI